MILTEAQTPAGKPTLAQKVAGPTVGSGHAVVCSALS
jgi:hypothetical protein